MDDDDCEYNAYPNIVYTDSSDLDEDFSEDEKQDKEIDLDKLADDVKRAKRQHEKEWNTMVDFLEDYSSEGSDDGEEGAGDHEDASFAQIGIISTKKQDEKSGKSEKRKVYKKPKFISNDHLFYDPNIDQDNEKFVEELRHKSRSENKTENPDNQEAESAKDANLEQEDHDGIVLNCPLCFTALCYQCQRHDMYKTQYRAIFVKNCRVNTEEILRFPDTSILDPTQIASDPQSTIMNNQPHVTPSTSPHNTRQAQSNREEGMSQSTSGESSLSHTIDQNTPDADEAYHPVSCDVCGAEVAVLDPAGVYHFFNVFPGY